MVEITMLNAMAGSDFVNSLDTQRSLGIQVLDLKSEIYGKNLIDLTDEEAQAAAKEIAARGMSVYCFSSELFHDVVEKGEAWFRQQHVAPVERLLQLAAILKPRVIRLLSAKTEARSGISDSVAYLKQQHPWLIPLYGEAIDRIHQAGFEATIENEANQNIWAQPSEITGFFDELSRPDKVYYTYDVQNLWQMGTFPTVEVYEELAPYIGFFHVKGGQYGPGSRTLQWKSSLEDASWPVADLTERVITDKKSPAICINPSHGQSGPDYDFKAVTLKDFAYMRSLVARLEASV